MDQTRTKGKGKGSGRGKYELKIEAYIGEGQGREKESLEKRYILVSGGRSRSLAVRQYSLYHDQVKLPYKDHQKYRGSEANRQLPGASEAGQGVLTNCELLSSVGEAARSTVGRIYPLSEICMDNEDKPMDYQHTGNQAVNLDTLQEIFQDDGFIWNKTSKLTWTLAGHTETIIKIRHLRSALHTFWTDKNDKADLIIWTGISETKRSSGMGVANSAFFADAHAEEYDWAFGASPPTPSS